MAHWYFSVILLLVGMGQAPKHYDPTCLPSKPSPAVIGECYRDDAGTEFYWSGTAWVKPVRHCTTFPDPIGVAGRDFCTKCDDEQFARCPVSEPNITTTSSNARLTLSRPRRAEPMDIPAISHHGAEWMPIWTCADKSRVLLTSEDGKKHCIKF